VSRLSQLKGDTMGFISSVTTLLERYPGVVITNSFSSIDANADSINFMFDLLRIIGVDNEKILEWVSTLLTGDDDNENGLLSVIELAVKALMIANIKNTLSCSVNPVIDDALIESGSGGIGQGTGVQIDLGAIDLFGTLKMAPTSQMGKYYYFDNEYPLNEMWKSKDFNAFLWYVINKSSDPSDSKLMWDNRNQIKSGAWEANKNTFLNTSADAYNSGLTDQLKKKPIIKCNFSERDFPKNNQLKGLLSAYTYHRTNKMIGPLDINKTIYEFNWDFVNSLKLFDSKVVVARLIDMLTGSFVFSANYSVDELVVQGKIGAIVKKIIEADDTQITDCFYTFSNEEYDRLLRTAELKHAGQYPYNGDVNTAITIRPDDLLNSLTGITQNSTLQEKTTIIKNTITQVSTTLAQDGSVYQFDKFSFGQGLINQLIENLTITLVTSILSPKVMFLFNVNSQMMGNKLPDSLDDVIESLGNLIIAIVREIKNIIIRELYNFLVEQLRNLIELFTIQITLEAMREYKELLMNLLLMWPFALGVWGLFKKQTVIGQIDNVNYADIIPTKTTPQDITC
jgi:hypothetical protein